MMSCFLLQFNLFSEIGPRGSKFFPFRVDLFQKGSKFFPFRVDLFQKKIELQGTNSFLLEQTPFQKCGTTFLTDLSPLNVYPFALSFLDGNSVWARRHEQCYVTLQFINRLHETKSAIFLIYSLLFQPLSWNFQEKCKHKSVLFYYY